MKSVDATLYDPFQYLTSHMDNEVEDVIIARFNEETAASARGWLLGAFDLDTSPKSLAFVEHVLANDPEPCVRSTALYTMVTQRGAEACFEQLRRVVLEDISSKVRFDAALALGGLETEEAAALVQEVLCRESNSGMRDALRQLLGNTEEGKK